MNDSAEPKDFFAETGLASKLLNDFNTLVRKQKRDRHKTVASKAAASFFDKDILTIADFFEPIGFDLRIPVKTSSDTIGDFFRQSFANKSVTPKKTEMRPLTDLIQNVVVPGPLTIRRFFEPL